MEANTIDTAKRAALQWHLGIVAEPPTDRAGKEFLAQYASRKYQLQGDTLLMRSGLSAAKKPLASNQIEAVAKLRDLNYMFTKKATSEQKPGLRQAPSPAKKDKKASSEQKLGDPQVQSPAKEPAAHVSLAQMGLELTPDVVDGISITSSAWSRYEPSENDMTSEHSSVKPCSSSVINDKITTFQHHLSYLSPLDRDDVTNLQSDSLEALRTAPLFSGKVLDKSEPETLSQYGLLCKALATKEGDESPPSTSAQPAFAWNDDPRIFVNTNTPWSTFICGSQGSGKSYTLSCMLENCLIRSGLGKLPSPLAAMVFHYDSFVSIGSKQLCEAAYLCSAGVPVRVLVSPTNYWQMKRAYEGISESSASGNKPQVVPIKFQDKHLNVSRMMSMMAVSDKDGPPPLYIEVILRILREMAIESQGISSLNYRSFRQRLDAEKLTGQQSGPLKLRLDLLESFLDQTPVTRTWQTKAPATNSEVANGAKIVEKAQNTKVKSSRGGLTDKIWDFEPGTLTIIDLSCPFVDESCACALFSICLDLFLESRCNGGRIVALDEAHKFMTSTEAATSFTNKLLSVIRQQRHLATRVIISTQEPTISPRLLDLCTVSIVHRFTSPEWFRALRGHLAGVDVVVDETTGSAAVAGAKQRDAARSMFVKIVELEPGEALIFCPSAILALSTQEDGNGKALGKLGTNWLKVKIRRRLTEDGGKSILTTKRT